MWGVWQYGQLGFKACAWHTMNLHLRAVHCTLQWSRTVECTELQGPGSCESVSQATHAQDLTVMWLSDRSSRRREEQEPTSGGSGPNSLLEARLRALSSTSWPMLEGISCEGGGWQGKATVRCRHQQQEAYRQDLEWQQLPRRHIAVVRSKWEG